MPRVKYGHKLVTIGWGVYRKGIRRPTVWRKSDTIIKPTRK